MITRYWRAFWTALRLTLRGQKPPALQHPALYAWVRELAVRVDAVYAAADQFQLDKPRREALTLRLDGRVMSLETVLAAIQYHAHQEYPSLLRSGLSHNMVAIYASNTNDQYWLTRLQTLPELQQQPMLLSLIDRLTTHLQVIPSQP